MKKYNLNSMDKTELLELAKSFEKKLQDEHFIDEYLIIIWKLQKIYKKLGNTKRILELEKIENAYNYALFN